MRLRVCENQVLILKELQRGDTVAYFRTDVNNPLTLLVNAAAAHLQRHAGGVHRGMHLAFRAFKRHMEDLFSVHFRINQQSLLWPGLYWPCWPRHMAKENGTTRGLLCWRRPSL